ncbi:MAG: hypothetical protein QOH02_937 [Gaiellaceae bacterium]|nr:hypothetical protein [Gaiellaceae bacterium]
MLGRATKLRLLAALGLAALVALGLAAASAGSTSSRRVEIVFTANGGGRYLDVTRWLRDDTRDCYARRTADETVAVSWKLTWSGSIVRTSSGYVLQALAPAPMAVKGSVKGLTVRDGCDVGDPEIDANWIGSDRCSGPLPVRLQGRASSARGVLALRGPIYGTPPTPCELAVRNDQLAAHVALLQPALGRLAAGRAFSVTVGTAHAGPGDHYLARQFCSAFPHIYEGVVYLYDCDDTLVWKGTVTLRPS